MPEQQLTLDPGHLKPSKPGNPLYCHEDFLNQMEANRANQVGKRASLLLQRLLLNERREFFKSTQGINKGWRRSRLGGTSGSHFYAWWAPRGSAPLTNGGFDTAPEGAIFLRAIRHHDDHTPLDAHHLSQNYIPLDAVEIRDDSLVPAPWTSPQNKFARARQNVRTLRGFPGSGKTTALWHAAETSTIGAVLYVTYSRELAALAQDYFSKLVPAHKRCHVVTFPEIVRVCSGAGETAEAFRASCERFIREVATLSPRLLGPWAESKSALYDEMHAHLIGAALPEPIARWPASSRRLSPKDYRALREKVIGRSAAEAVLEVADALNKRGDKPLEDRFFPELALARRAVDRLRASSLWLQNVGLGGFDCLAIDEAQDLTPVEALLLVEIALASRQKTSSRITFLAAGDEAQTIRATDFTWAWFHDLLHHKLGSPTDFELRANLRSPHRIAEIVNRVWTLYGHIAKEERPGGAHRAELEDESGDQVVFCTARPGEELSDLLTALSVREGLAIVNLAETAPDWVPDAVRPHLVSVADIKGLDFHSVCILNGGQFVQRVIGSGHGRAFSQVDDLSKRLAIDQLRVAVSRPAERLYWLEVDPTGGALKESQSLLAGFTWDLPLPVVPSVVLTALEQEALPVEERIRLCEADARQFLPVKPDIAWSRASQAVALIGPPGNPAAVQDVALRRSAHLTMAEIAFCLAFRGVKLGSQLGAPDLFGEALRHAELAGDKTLAHVLEAAEGMQRGSPADDLTFLMATRNLLSGMEALEAKEGSAWFRLELQSRASAWTAQLEKQLDRNILAHDAARLLPGFYSLFQAGDIDAKTRKARLRAASTLVEGKHPGLALELLNLVPDCDVRLKARCMEAAGDLAGAAETFLAAGFTPDALRCYRTIPDFDKALQVAAKLGDHPARESLEWLGKMKHLAESRPAEFKKVMLPSETKYLEAVLETALGVTRKKPVKKAVKKAVPPNKRAVTRSPVKRT